MPLTIFVNAAFEAGPGGASGLCFELSAGLAHVCFYECVAGDRGGRSVAAFGHCVMIVVSVYFLFY